MKQEEERLLAVRKVEENARQSSEQAERAKEEIRRLREQKDRNLSHKLIRFVKDGRMGVRQINKLRQFEKSALDRRYKK